MLRFENVTFTYESADAPVISDLSFEVPDKSFVSIIGASGSGKTTIFRLLNALERPQSGNITIDGKDIKGLKNYAGYMPQQDLLFPWRTVERNVMLPMQIKKVSKAEQKEKAREMLERVGLLEYADKYPRELSGGMRQRVSFARTLCEGSDLMLLDEPFSALDSITRMEMREWLRDQWERLDKTILFITHDVEEALYLSEKIFVLMGNPVNRLKCVDVPLPKNRDAAMLKREDIRQLKEELVELLRKEASE
ncbi:MAG: ABC transporter ATP-binding protein [Candidatus Alectryocaccobium sp.]|jgi:putative hydroxymethylpyrimidine transport system ATP-binding protein|nr:ABC transporter ATP-binding protein [Lachnospiraceae bacterium]